MVVRAFHSTPLRRSAARPFITRPKLPLPPLVHPVGVVDLARAVDGKTDQEAVPGEELTPPVTQESAVCLDRVNDPLGRPLHRLGQLDRAAEEVQAHHGRLTALPGHHHFRRGGMRLDELAQVQSQPS